MVHSSMKNEIRICDECESEYLLSLPKWPSYVPTAHTFCMAIRIVNITSSTGDVKTAIGMAQPRTLLTNSRIRNDIS